QGTDAWAMFWAASTQWPTLVNGGGGFVLATVAEIVAEMRPVLNPAGPGASPPTDRSAALRRGSSGSISPGRARPGEPAPGVPSPRPGRHGHRHPTRFLVQVRPGPPDRGARPPVRG